MRVLLTGASGLIGRHIRRGSFPNGAELLTASRTAVFASGDEHHCVDLSSAEEAAALIRFVKPTHVIHAAWETRPPTYWEAIANLAWLDSTARMAATFGETGGRRFVQVGSCAEYDWSDRVCTEDVTRDRPSTRYGKAKLAAFRAVQAAAHGRFEAAEARIFFVFGPGEHPDRVVPAICRGYITGRVPDLGSGRQERDFLHSSDAACALVVLACAAGIEGVVNVGSGIATPLSTVAEILAELAGADETGLGRKPDRAGDPPLLVASADRLRALKWSPAMSLRQGLAQTFNWWRQELDKER